ncbi:MAG: LTA synthase family protein [Deltaproteobacteria bacterium]|nr:LTA synthase family protein [Deltaproteobacteria bacterium]
MPLTPKMKSFRKIYASAATIFKPVYRRELIELFALFFLIELPYLVVVLYKHEFDLLDSTVVLYFVEKIFFDFALFFWLILWLLRLTERRFVALGFAIFYLLLITGNTGVYFFSSTLLEKHHLALITPYSITGFISFESIIGVALLLSACAVLWFPLRGLAPKVTRNGVLYWGVFTVAMGVVDIPEHYAARKKSDERFDKRVMVFRNAQLEYSAQNPLTAFINYVILPTLWQDLRVLKGSDTYRRYMKKYDFIPDDYTVTDDLSQIEGLAKTFGIPLGERAYPKLNLRRFTRVVVVFVESLSLDTLQCYNERLRRPTSFFLCSDSIRARTFQNLRTSAAPTLQGLTVTFFSHPNFEIQAATGFGNSAIARLKKAGYRTIFVRSASKFFADENIRFKRWGFDTIIAREDFDLRPELRKYIYGWGLEDRILYQQVVDLLERNRGEKLFVSVLGTDTHPLHGKKIYRHLSYPSLPIGFDLAYGYARDFMKAVYHADYDLEQFIARLKSKNLFDDETLIVLTADHSYQPNNVSRYIPGHPYDSFGRIPLVLLTAQTLPAIRTKVLSSQIDIFPTLFHLLGLSIPRGWWGQSLFYPDRTDMFIGFQQDSVSLETDERSLLLDMRQPNNRVEREFKKLFSTVLTQP